MFSNFIYFFLLVVLVVMFGWLTWKAIKAKRLWVKIVGGLLAGALTLVLAAVTFIAGKGLAVAYVPPAPAPELTIAGTPEQVARGEYLANIGCISCHGADGKGVLPLSGGMDLSKEVPVPVGTIIAANITPGGVLAELSDGELFRVIRHGYGPHGRLGFMSFLPYGQLSDEDIKSIIAYLRSQEPVVTPTKGGDKTNLLGAMLFFGTGIVPMPEHPEGVVTAPPAGDTAEYGKYVATFGECRGCHGPDMTGAAATQLGPAYPNPRPIVATWTREQFIQVMRTGIRPGGTELKMPWKNASKMSDADLGALYTYLTTAP
jgi:mono/diheme cytochrome c family protein